MKPQLISFALCPYVQASVITLSEKNVEYDIRTIDLANPPKWFIDIAPLRKVPALQVDGITLFDSTVINEYLDEVNPPSLHPSDPLQKALNRAWMVFAADLTDSWYEMSFATTEADFDKYEAEVEKGLYQLEAQISAGPFFNGKHFSLVDTVFAPVLVRIDFTVRALQSDLLTGLPNIKAWLTALVERDSVKASIDNDFDQKILNYIISAGGFSARQRQP